MYQETFNVILGDNSNSFYFCQNGAFKLETIADPNVVLYNIL